MREQRTIVIQLNVFLIQLGILFEVALLHVMGSFLSSGQAANADNGKQDLGTKPIKTKKRNREEAEQVR